MNNCSERSACCVASATLCNSSPSPDRNLSTDSEALFWNVCTLEMASVRTEENPEPGEVAAPGDCMAGSDGMERGVIGAMAYLRRSMEWVIMSLTAVIAAILA